jgi:hypothetical protein
MNLDINYGLIVVDPSQKAPQDILHFVGYWEYPDDKTIDLLREELRDDPELGLQDKWDKVDILLAPDSVLEEYKAIVFKDQENDNQD